MGYRPIRRGATHLVKRTIDGSARDGKQRLCGTFPRALLLVPHLPQLVAPVSPEEMPCDTSLGCPSSRCSH
jgi:hypothetical protein